jgi:hypothetical protein
LLLTETPRNELLKRQNKCERLNFANSDYCPTMLADGTDIDGQSYLSKSHYITESVIV